VPEYPRDRPHLFREGGGRSAPYTRPPSGGGDEPPNPPRDRETHARNLEAALVNAFRTGEELIERRQTHYADDELGYYLEVRLPSGEEGVLQSLEDRGGGIELLAARQGEEGSQLVATLFVPRASTARMVRKVQSYRTKDDPRSGRPRNEKLVSRMEAARLANLRSIYVGEAGTFPQPGREAWWELWLRAGRLEAFEATAGALAIALRPHVLEFPERQILLALATPEQLAVLMQESLSFAEVRLARDVPTFFLDLPAREQASWVEDARERLGQIESDTAVTILDSGVNRGHPLLEDVIAEHDQHTIHPGWGVTDDAARWRGHGTAIAGLAAYGDLTEVFPTSGEIRRTHRLESVKILPPSGENDPDLFGAITVEAVARAETQAPARRRVVCLATTEAANDRGVPSSWSAALDKIAFGGDDEPRRLVVVAAGNVHDGDISPTGYIDVNDTSGIQSPAQAWNALTVGAFTVRTNVVDPDASHCAPLAPAGDLCPTSRTAVTWDRSWPSKPDVVLEGGNYIVDGEYALSHDDLCLLTTNNQFSGALFRPFWATSAASALAARMSAQLTASLPHAWPETIRALMVHSAEWTPAMLRRAGARRRADVRILPLPAKQSLVRRFGYGVPDLQRALFSAKNDLTLVVQDVLVPYERHGGRARTREMHVHPLPWPRNLLLELGEAEVEMRVTLSYFIEPRPGDRGWKRRYQYMSHGLRFEAKHPLESVEQFRARLSAAERDDDVEVVTPGEADKWDLRSFVRNSGSIHSDTWRGTAADLAERSAIGVYPVGGWWKDDLRMERYEHPAPYSLIVSIRAPDTEIDIYEAVEAELAAMISAAAEIEVHG
jgi:hypothetical protein